MSFRKWRTTALIAFALVSSGAQTSAETCFPVGKEQALVGKYFTYLAKDPSDPERQLTVTFAAVAPSEEGGALWCQYVGRPEDDGVFLFAKRTDADGVDVAQLLPKSDGTFFEQPAAQGVRDCMRKLGPCETADPGMSLRCDQEELVVRFETKPGEDPRIVRYRFREDGVLLSLTASVAGDPVRETILVEEGDWTGRNCVTAPQQRSEK